MIRLFGLTRLIECAEAYRDLFTLRSIPNSEGTIVGASNKKIRVAPEDIKSPYLVGPL